MRRVCCIAAICLGGGAAADPVAPGWADRCQAALERARDALARVEPAFRGARVTRSVQVVPDEAYRAVESVELRATIEQDDYFACAEAGGRGETRPGCGTRPTLRADAGVQRLGPEGAGLMRYAGWPARRGERFRAAFEAAIAACVGPRRASP